MNSEQRTALGAIFLDDVLPGWATRIDPELVRSHDPQCRILGQLFRDSTTVETHRANSTIGRRALHLTLAHAAALGFLAQPARDGLDPDLFGVWLTQERDALRDGWTREIARRSESLRSQLPSAALPPEEPAVMAVMVA